MRALLTACLALVGLACQSSSVATLPETFREANVFRFHYQAHADPGARQGPVDLWIPIPENTPEQRIEELAIEGPAEYSLRPLRNGSGRALHVRSATGPVGVQVSYTVRRLEARARKGASPEQLASALGPDRMVPLDGKVAAVATQLASSTPGATSGAQVGQQLYWHTLERMSYEKPAAGGWGRGDAEWACDSRLGNCSDFHSYFIGLARSRDIPARFEIGFAVPELAPEQSSAAISGYHCWAWFWSELEGWIPVDISEADKHPELAEYYLGRLDDRRVTISGGRDVELEPPAQGGALNFFVYPYAEVAGRELTTGVSKKFWVTRPW